MNAIPGQLNEALDGFLLVMLLFAAGYFMIFLIKEVLEFKRLHRNWKHFHNSENSTAIALLTLISGLAMKLGAEWWWFHLKNNGDTSSWPILVPLVIAGTLVSVWGVICLLKSLSNYEWPRWTWAVLVAIALVSSATFTIY